MIIDFHTHIFPEKIVDKAIKVLQDNAKRVSGQEGGAVIDGRRNSLIASMERSNIDYSVVMPIATNPKQTESINSFAAEINAKDGIFSFGSIHPEDTNWESNLEKIKEYGLVGIKLHPEYQQFYIDSQRSLEILKKARELGLFVMIHSGEDQGVLPPVHCPPQRLLNVCDKIETDHIIAAHLGGYNAWEDVLKYLCDTPLFFDTSFSVGIMDDLLAKEIIIKHSCDKILFGTDSPWLDQKFVVDRIKKLNLGKENEEKIFYKNGIKILGLK